MSSCNTAAGALELQFTYLDCLSVILQQGFDSRWTFFWEHCMKFQFSAMFSHFNWLWMKIKCRHCTAVNIHNNESVKWSNYWKCFAGCRVFCCHSVIKLNTRADKKCVTQISLVEVLSGLQKWIVFCVLAWLLAVVLCMFEMEGNGIIWILWILIIPVFRIDSWAISDYFSSKIKVRRYLGVKWHKNH